MRFALSAMAATSGLMLLGLAFYGQPALYLQQLREEFDRFASSSGSDQSDSGQSVEADRAAVDDKMAALQQQVARLRDELAARQALEAQPATIPQAKPNPLVQPVAPAPVPTPAPPTSAPPTPAPPTSAPLPPAPRPAPSVALTTQPAAAVAPPAGVPAQGDPPRLDVPSPVANTPPLPLPPPVAAQPRRDLASAEPTAPRPAAPRPEPSKQNPPKTEPAKVEPAKADAARAETVKPMPQKPAVVTKAPPPTPPLPSSPRQDVDDTQSVLARLRQIGPATVQQADTADIDGARQPDLRPPLPPPSLPKLNSARAALAAGRVDDARRLLQEAQLQLVFRPVNATGDEPPLTGKGAADVAHALEALSANNIPLSRRYIDVAADDVSGRGTSMSSQTPEPRATGYAPAYPPR